MKSRSSKLVILLALFGCFLVAQDTPEQMLWKTLKRELAGPDGEVYFRENVKDVLLPALKGRADSWMVNEGVSKVVLRMLEGDAPEVTIIVHHLGYRMKRAPRAGEEIQFSGVASSFTKDPLMLTLDVERHEVRGIEFEKMPN